jgi:hypothetical protein
MAQDSNHDLNPGEGYNSPNQISVHDPNFSDTLSLCVYRAPVPSSGSQQRARGLLEPPLAGGPQREGRRKWQTSHALETIAYDDNTASEIFEIYGPQEYTLKMRATKTPTKTSKATSRKRSSKRSSKRSRRISTKPRSRLRT